MAMAVLRNSIARSTCRRHAKYERLIATAKEVPAASTIVVHPCDETSLRGRRSGAGRHHCSDPGRAGGEDLRAWRANHGLDVEQYEIVDVPDSRRVSGEGRRADPPVQRRAADERQPAHR